MASRALNALGCVAHLFKTIKGKQLIKHNDHILVALSGGQDSICLGFMLWVLRGQLRSQTGHICCHHLWQEGSFFTMLHLAQFNLFCSSRILFSLGTQPLLSEQGARDWRHAVIQRACSFYAYDLCTQGHTRSDRAETVLFNLVRGAGLAGISALQWDCQKDVLPSCMLYATLLDLHRQEDTNPPLSRGAQRARFGLHKQQQTPPLSKQALERLNSYPHHRCNRAVILYSRREKASVLRTNSSKRGRGQYPFPPQGSHISSRPVKSKQDG